MRAEGASGGGALVVPPSRFGADLVALADPGGPGLRAWVIVAGMGYGDATAWWRRRGRRERPHEGVDLAAYIDARGRRRTLGAGAPVPAPWDGVVATVVEDFLGSSVFLRHGAAEARGWRLHSILGHLLPGHGVAAGTEVAAGETVGRIADPALRGRRLAPHLHLSLALVAPEVPPADLGWEALQDPGCARLLDPAALLGPVAP